MRRRKILAFHSGHDRIPSSIVSRFLTLTLDSKKLKPGSDTKEKIAFCDRFSQSADISAATDLGMSVKPELSEILVLRGRMMSWTRMGIAMDDATIGHQR